MKKIRKFLEKNQIFFTTLSSLLLSIMAIIVSYNSNIISKQQMELNYNENKPDFHISAYYVRNPQTGMAEEYVMNISKNSGIAKNISINYISYLLIKFQDSLMKNYEVKFQLIHYLDEGIKHGNSSGIIKTVTGYKNNERLSNLMHKIEKELKNEGYKYVYNEVETYIRIYYIDFNEMNNIERYKLESGNGILLKDADDKLFNFQNYEYRIFLDDIEKINIKEIIKKIEKVIYKKP